MKKSTKILLEVGPLFVGCALMLCSIGTPFADQEKIVGIGDSTVAGYPYVTSDQNGSRRTGGYEPTLEDLLVNSGRNAIVLNYGHPGELSSETNGRIQSVLDKEKPDWTLIQAGTNDLFWVSTGTVMNNLASAANKVKSSGRNAGLATLTPDSRGNGKPISEMNNRIRSWTKDNDVPLADLYNAVASNWNNLTYEGLHPNREGYVVIANTWFTTIPELAGANIIPIIMLLLDE